MFCRPLPILRHIHWFGWRRLGAFQANDRAFAPDGAWIEVLRIATRAVTDPSTYRRFGGVGEGGGQGCWFVEARGSGIFMHVGRSLRARSRGELVSRLGINATSGAKRANVELNMEVRDGPCTAPRVVR